MLLRFPTIFVVSDCLRLFLIATIVFFVFGDLDGFQMLWLVSICLFPLGCIFGRSCCQV